MTTQTTSKTDATIEALGFIGGIMISLSLIPQVIKTFRTKDASSISYSYQAIYIVGCTFINIYAFYINMWVIYVPCVIEQVMIVTLTLMKIIFDCCGERREEYLWLDSGCGALIETLLADKNNGAVRFVETYLKATTFYDLTIVPKRKKEYFHNPRQRIQFKSSVVPMYLIQLSNI